jgi:hypothetical protein
MSAPLDPCCDCPPPPAHPPHPVQITLQTAQLSTVVMASLQITGYTASGGRSLRGQGQSFAYVCEFCIYPHAHPRTSPAPSPPCRIPSWAGPLCVQASVTVLVTCPWCCVCVFCARPCAEHIAVTSRLWTDWLS